jgi:hypothetical protein
LSDCKQFGTTIESYVAGELSDRELGPLLAHCRECDGCRRLLELHRDLTVAGSQVPVPDERDFSAMHERVLAQVTPREQGPARSFPVGTTLRAAAALAAAVLLFVVGLSVGRGLPGQAVEARNGSMTNRLVAAIDSEAASNTDLADVENSRFTFSNVSFRPVNGNQVALGFDVTTHLQLVEPAESELVREALVHSLLNPSGTGTRLKALSFAARSMEPKVREALIFAMQRDESLAVRLKALTILSEHLDQTEVELAVLAALRDDESVQMRLVALDYLASHSVDRAQIREAIEDHKRPGDEALQVQLAAYDDRL